MGQSNFQTLHIILFAIIVLNILDFFEVLDPFWDYVKKIISWILVGVVFYRLSPSNILLGVKARLLDFLFVVSAFALTMNDMLRYARLMREYMLENAALFVDIVRESGPAVLTVNVTQEVFNTASTLSFVDLSPYLTSLASQITMSNPVVHVAVSHAGEEVLFGIFSPGLTGSVLALYNTLMPHIPYLEQTGLLVGFAGLLIIALLVSLTIPITQRSFVGLFDNDVAHGFSRVLARFVVVFAAYVFFFLFVFSLVMEWLAIAIDAPILMIAIIVSLFLVHLHRVSFNFAQWEQFVTGFGDVSNFVNLFREKRTVLLGISGILVLHVMTEILHYLLPFTLPLRDQLYLAQLGPGHDNLFSLASSIPDHIGAALVLTGWFFVLFLPGYIWYKIYKLRGENHHRHHPRFAPWFLALFSSCLYMMLVHPMIWFRGIEGRGLIGVDFYTQAQVVPWQSLIVAIGIAVLIFVLAQFSIRKFLYLIPLGTSILFLGAYSVLFFMSSATAYILLLIVTLSSQPFAAVGFGLFALFSLLFYIPAFVLFVYEIIRD